MPGLAGISEEVRKGIVMYKYKESKGLKRSGGGVWWAIVLLFVGELVLLAMIMNQNRILHSTIDSVSSQLEEFRHADPMADIDKQFNRVNTTVNGVLDILGSMKLNDDQMEKLNRIWPSTVPTQDNAGENSGKPTN